MAEELIYRRFILWTCLSAAVLTAVAGRVWPALRGIDVESGYLIYEVPVALVVALLFYLPLRWVLRWPWRELGRILGEGGNASLLRALVLAGVAGMGLWLLAFVVRIAVQASDPNWLLSIVGIFVMFAGFGAVWFAVPAAVFGWWITYRRAAV